MYYYTSCNNDKQLFYMTVMSKGSRVVQMLITAGLFVSVVIHIRFCVFFFFWSRCTIQKECARGLLARSWITVGEGPQQCPSITLTPPEISISADIKVPLILLTLLLL